MTTTSPAAPGPDHHDIWMRRAIAVASTVRATTAPNPWVGCLVRCLDGRVFSGATEPAGQRHAERVALDAARAAGADTTGATVFTTLEPCDHEGRTGACTDALVDAAVGTVVVAIEDPDQRVRGAGLTRLRAAGIEVVLGPGAADVTEQLAAYLHHRRTGRPYVILKLAMTFDGRTAAADGSSRWITGPEARREVHRYRAESGAVVIGAGTARVDDPALTVREVDGPDPRRVVLGRAPAGARVHPCLEWSGTLGDLLDTLGRDGVLQVLVEGGASVAASFHREGLVDRYVVHLAPALMGGDDGVAALHGLGAPSVDAMWRGRIVSVRTLGNDLEVQLAPTAPHRPQEVR